MVWQTIDGQKAKRRPVIWVSWDIRNHAFRWWTIACSYYQAVSGMGWDEIPVNYAVSRLYDAPDRVIKHFSDNRYFMLKK